jgi:hypothetical protein
VIEQLCNTICEDIIEELYESKKPYKYSVTCILQQRNTMNLHLSKSCYWDSVSDATITVQYPKKQQEIHNKQQQEKKEKENQSIATTQQNNQIQAICTVFAVSYYSTV